MGTPLREVIETIGGPGAPVKAVLSGVANPFLPGDKLDTPLSYGAMEAAGTGLGAAGFLVFSDADDLAAVAAGVARFLAVESCGQCTPCKQDGLAIADILTRVVCGQPESGDGEALASHVATVADEARCALAGQQQRVIGSLLSLFPDAVKAHCEDGRRARRPRPHRPLGRHHRRRPGHRRRAPAGQAARLDVRRDRLRPVPRRPARPATRRSHHRLTGGTTSH